MAELYGICRESGECNCGLCEIMMYTLSTRKIRKLSRKELERYHMKRFSGVKMPEFITGQP
jgi:hypothetical protein